VNQKPKRICPSWTFDDMQGCRAAGVDGRTFGSGNGAGGAHFLRLERRYRPAFDRSGWRFPAREQRMLPAFVAGMHEARSGEGEVVLPDGSGQHSAH
jgi:hypothetical protein